MESMNNKIRLGILVITAFMMLILSAVVPYPVAGFSQTGPMKLPTLRVVQNGDLSMQEPLILTDEQGSKYLYSTLPWSTGKSHHPGRARSIAWRLYS